MEAQVVVIDACCMLNILATRREVEIISATGLRLLDTPKVSEEPKFLLSPPDKDGERAKINASTSALREAGLLSTQDLGGEEFADAFVRAATFIKDTDASCIAVAGVLKIPLFSDDAKASKIARSMFPEIKIISTLSILHLASEVLAWTPQEQHMVAKELFWGGNFAPPRKDPLSSWYAKLLQPPSMLKL